MKNGSFARQEIRDRYADKDWNRFSECLSLTNPGNDGKIGFYFQEREISPFVKGYYYFDANDNEKKDSDWAPESHIRAVVESQFMLVYLHSKTIGFRVKAILATGGGSKNRAILQVLSDIFGVPVMIGEVTKSAALGAAFRALHGWYCHKQQSFLPFHEVAGELEYSEKIEPDMDSHLIYAHNIQRYASLLQRVTSSCDQK